MMAPVKVTLNFEVTKETSVFFAADMIHSPSPSVACTSLQMACLSCFMLLYFRFLPEGLGSDFPRQSQRSCTLEKPRLSASLCSVITEQLWLILVWKKGLLTLSNAQLSFQHNTEDYIISKTFHTICLFFFLYIYFTTFLLLENLRH